VIVFLSAVVMSSRIRAPVGIVTHYERLLSTKRPKRVGTQPLGPISLQVRYCSCVYQLVVITSPCAMMSNFADYHLMYPGRIALEVHEAV
jgi:hypothetical protein